MGDQRTYGDYDEFGYGFSEYEYRKEGESIVAPNGVVAKVVYKVDAGEHQRLPAYAQHSDVYMLRETETSAHFIEKLRVFADRHALIDIDWNHSHKPWKKGDVHVHDFVPNGKKGYARLPPRAITQTEMGRYRPLIQMVYPAARFNLIDLGEDEKSDKKTNSL